MLGELRSFTRANAGGEAGGATALDRRTLVQCFPATSRAMGEAGDAWMDSVTAVVRLKVAAEGEAGGGGGALRGAPTS